MKLQLTLANVLLLIAAVATGVSLWLQLGRNAVYEDRLPGMREAARELHVGDPTKFHAVRPHPEWYGETKWVLHVPQGQAFKLHLATTEIPHKSNKMKLPQSKESCDLSPGRHVIELRLEKAETNVVEVFVDASLEMRVEESEDWHPINCGMSTSSDVHACRSFDHGEPVLLNHSLFDPSKQNANRTHFNGMSLWISSGPSDTSK